ncbi:MAG: GH92 family glycosyl hydrolase [Bacteroidales bacterium]|nr:GH92 family glycosyl hydrolase [Bacteroidales bacterium]
MGQKQLIFILLSLAALNTTAQKTTLVNPFIGTDAHGHTYPGAVAPFGMVQLSPDTRLEGWDGCSGYHWTDSIIYGFSHTHLSGTGCGDFCDILFVPTTSLDIKADNFSFFRKENEKAEAGFYSVLLQKYNIAVQLTATERCGYHSYTYPADSNRCIIIDLKHRDELLDCSWKQEDDNTIVGMRRSKAWNENQIVYFAARFSLPLKRVKFDQKTKRLLLSFGKNRKKEGVVEAYVALSSVNEDGALRNLKAEKSKTFSDARKEAQDLWIKELDKIKVEGGSFQNRVKFYTALYHSLICPNLYSDVNGKYRGMDNKIYSTSNYQRYHVFSLWDTYRTLHPLLSIIDTKRSLDFVNTFLDIYKQSGLLPMWELANFETYCMIGEHGASVLSELYMKGIRANDKLTLESLINTLDSEKRKTNLDKMKINDYHFFGLDLFDKYGFVPSEKEHESVSKTLEYSYNMYCAAQVANAMGQTALYNEYIAKSQSWKNLFNPSSGFIEPKENNRFLPNFDPRQIDRNYTEGNGWHYTFYVPHDIETLINMVGGDKKFIAKLDSCFFTSSQTTGRNQADVTGLIGQYSQGNEPSQHTAYLYAYAGAAYRTQQLVRLIMDSLYTYNPDGLCGNDDAGQMSAWFVMSALGFYPVNPVDGEFVIGSPLFDKAIITLENGKTFTVNAPGADKKKYVKSLSLNGKPYDKSYITYNDIMKGGRLDFVMSSEPNEEFAADLKARSHSKNISNLIVPVPYLEYIGTKSFDSIIDVSINTLSLRDSVFVIMNQKTDSANENSNFKSQNVKLSLENTAEISVAAVSPAGKMSKMITSNFIKIPKGRSVRILTKYDNQYNGGGDFALIDNLKGDENWRLGAWQGYFGEDFACIIDLGKEDTLRKVSANFIQDANAWIFLPLDVTYSFSNDAKTWFQTTTVPNKFDERLPKIIYSFAYSPNVPCRYVKVEARNRKTLPEWHLSAGEKAWIMIDEVEAEN